MGIWSIGYPAGFTVLGKPGMIIEKRAGNLSQKLANANLGVRPLLFITHSMAGLVVKSLIVDSQTQADPDRKRLVAMVRGIVFCATPHRGSGFANAAGVLGTFFGGSQDHVDEMQANAEPLDLLHDQFIEWHHHHPVPVESYAENVGLFRTRWFRRPLPLGLVVPRASANPGIAGHTVRDVDEDHLTLVKPRNRQHDVYAGVLRFVGSEPGGKLPPETAAETAAVYSDLAAVERRAAKMFEWRTSDDSLLTVGFNHLTLGRVHLLRAVLESPDAHLDSARTALDAALATLRQATPATTSPAPCSPAPGCTRSRASGTLRANGSTRPTPSSRCVSPTTY